MARSTKVLVALVALALVTVLAGPALAETVTYTTSFVNRFGNTVTVETTYVDGVLTYQVMREVQPDGTVKLLKTWEFYPNGKVKTSEEWRYSPTSPTHIKQEYSDTGVLLFQLAEMWLDGELAIQSLTTYDSTGLLLKQEDRILTTLADGTKVWEVTVSTLTYLDGVLVSTRTTTQQYPYGYNFEAQQRPGWGYGDENHEHTGPGGQHGAEVSGGNGHGADGGDEVEVRPGWGYGDENHEHRGNGK